MKRLLFLLLLVSQVAFGQSVYTYGGKALTYSGDVLIEVPEYHAEGRSGLTLPDVYGNDAKILPAVFTGNASGHYRNTTQNMLSSDDWVMYFEFENNNSGAGRYALMAQAWQCYFRMGVTDNNWYFSMTDGVNNRNITISVATLPYANRKYSFKITHDKDGSTTIYESDVQVGTASGTFGNVPNGTNHWGARDGAADLIPSTISLISGRIYSDLAETTLVGSYVFTGGSILFDISGNGKNFTGNSIIDANGGFSANGSSYLLDSGHALWQKSGSVDVYIPSGGQTTLPATGYTLTKNYEGSSTKLNMAPCLIGFNETSSAATALEIFDRSNATRQTAASRASDYYDATSLATRSRYHISEVYPHEVLTTLFEAAYQNKVFSAISKEGTDFSLTDFISYTTQRTGAALASVESYCQIDQVLTVGTDKNVRTINQAITRSYDDYAITIDAGTYLEFLNLTVKRLNLVGSGVRETIIFYSIEAQSAVPTLDIATNSTFNNLIIDKREVFSAAKPIVNITSCSPTFTNCQIGRTTYVDGFSSQNPMTITGASVVNMIGCDIVGTKYVGATAPWDLLIQGTSVLNFEGEYLFARVKAEDTSEVNIDVDYFYTNGANEYQLGLYAGDDAVVDLKINVREIAWNPTTISEQPAGTFTPSAYRLYGNASLELTGNQITGATRIYGAGNIVLFKDIVSTLGHFWCKTDHADAATASITFDSCQIVLDADSDATGLHIIEETVGATVNIINGCILEFSGHQGNWFTMGNPIVAVGKLYIRDSQIIDNCNDNVPYGANYGATLFCRQIDAENVIITNQNWDDVGTNSNIQITKDVGGLLYLALTNDTLNNSEINTSPIAINNNNALDVTDYYCEVTVTYNSSAYKIATSAGVSATIYAALTAACP